MMPAAASGQTPCEIIGNVATLDVSKDLSPAMIRYVHSKISASGQCAVIVIASQFDIDRWEDNALAVICRYVDISPVTIKSGRDMARVTTIGGVPVMVLESHKPGTLKFILHDPAGCRRCNPEGNRIEFSNGVIA